MHFTRASQIAMSKRLPHIKAFVAQVRKALADPSLPAPRRERLQRRLESLTAAVHAHRSGA